MSTNVDLIRAAYDRIAPDYDARWSVHVSEPQNRLTRELGVTRGERCADLGCGTGLDTVELLKLAAPGEVVGVDLSPAMLAAAQKRARASGHTLTTWCQGAEEFAQQAEPHSFDVITLRFCIGQLDWRSLLPRLPQLLRAGGRIGIVTILASSAPQAYTTYRGMARELGLSEIPMSALASIDEITEAVRAGGAAISSAWTHRFRLEFERGQELATWLQSSGIVATPALSALPASVSDALWSSFAARVERFREAGSVPLDFELAGVVAHACDSQQV
jgi:ubiquinone/menaquinone biosynthesis C-methylase UbiE